MRQVTHYTAAIKASVLTKALAPNAPSVLELSKVFNIPPSTIHTWLTTMGKKEAIKSTTLRRRPHDESVICKFQAVIDTLGKTEEEQGAYCRTKGIHSHHLELWKQQMLEGLGKPEVKSNALSTKVSKAAQRHIEDENKQLKRDLHRKEKALAELTALLVLKKKADLLWGGSEDV
ncbi:MAG: hypothetical protein H0U75_06635 [Legionella sp.]|nr:hypothetical protein [Legionella sp.]